jgi:hypothetical protein
MIEEGGKSDTEVICCPNNISKLSGTCISLLRLITMSFCWRVDWIGGIGNNFKKVSGNGLATLHGRGFLKFSQHN